MRRPEMLLGIGAGCIALLLCCDGAERGLAQAREDRAVPAEPGAPPEQAEQPVPAVQAVAADEVPAQAVQEEVPPQVQVQQLNDMPVQQAVLANQALFANNARGRMRNLQQNRVMNNEVELRSAPAIHEPFSGPLTAAKVSRAIQDATLFLHSQQASDGSIGESWYARGGSTALATLALLAAGGDPAADHGLKQALEWLLKLEDDNNTYVRGIRANVYEYALRKVPYDGRLREALERDFRWLLKALGDRQGWRYNMESTDWDNSCTQYGVLGIWAASRAGFDPGEGFWRRMSTHFRKVQVRDGGWGYTDDSSSSANMATAGLASLFLVFDMSHGREYYRADQPRVFSSGEAGEVLKSLERGMSWLGRSNPAERGNAYYLYGIERAGVASGRKRFGGQDWFAEGAQTVLQQQQADGSIQLGYSPVISTALSTLFLVYGGAPVVFQKLEHGRDQDWNLNPRDLANLSRHLWSAYEQPLNWHSVSIDAPAGELEAPILFVSGSRALKLSDEQVARLRQYVLRGGTLFAEPGDHSRAFHDSVVQLLARMFPPQEFPGWELKPLPPDHGVYTVLEQRWTASAVPRLLGASDGSRTFLFLSEEYLAADWQRNEVESDAFKLAMNLMFYATDLGIPQGRFATAVPDTAAAAARPEKLTVARLRHPAAARGWDLAAPAWEQMVEYVRHTTGRTLVELPPVTAEEAARPGSTVRLLHLTGRGRLELSAAERQALVRFVDQGGTLLADAWGGDPEFARSARELLGQLFGPLQELPRSSALASGRFEGGVDLTRGVRYKLPARRQLRERKLNPGEQHLEMALRDERPAVIFSAFDLSAAMAGIELYHSLGYKPESARKVVSNVVALLAD